MEAVYPSRVVPLFLREFAERGGDLARIKAAFQLPENAENEAEVVVPLDAIEEIADEMSTALGDRDMGLHFGLEFGRGRLGLLEFLWESSQTLGDSLDALLRHQRALSRFVMHALDINGELATLRQWVPGRRACLGRHGNEFMIAMLVRMAHSLVGEKLEPLRVWFAHPAPRDRRALDAFFGAERLEFSAGFNGLEFDAHYLAKAQVRPDPALAEVIDAQLGATALPAAPPFPQLARQMIERALAEGHPHIHQVAKLLHLTPRTLQRRLAQLDLSFQDLLDDVRHEASRIQLGKPRVTIEQVARMLGYARVSTFARAFRRWTGQTPVEFMKESRG